MQHRILGLCGPSGAGKGTLGEMLRKMYPHMHFSVSSTTRPSRLGEVDGRDYHFVTAEKFREQISQDLFFEYEEVYEGRFYGTLLAELEPAHAELVLVDVDIEGARSIKRAYGDRAFVTFVAPPNMEVLEQRLRGRGTENEAEIQRRLAKAPHEMMFAHDFDLLVVSRDRIEAFGQLYRSIETFLHHP